MLKRLLVALALLACATLAHAQNALPQDNDSISVTTGLTYQSIAPANNARRMVEIQNNNNTADSCWINVDGVVAAGNTTSSTVTTTAGASVTAAKASILLQPGQAYVRYYPSVPLGPIVGTCASSGDGIYAGVR